MWCRGVGCRVQGAGCRVQGAGCRVQGAERKGERAGGEYRMRSAKAPEISTDSTDFKTDRRFEADYTDLKTAFTDLKTETTDLILSGVEAGSYSRLIDSCITQLKVQGPSRTCNESKEGVEYRMRSAKAPEMSAGVMIANVSSNLLGKGIVRPLS